MKNNVISAEINDAASLLKKSGFHLSCDHSFSDITSFKIGGRTSYYLEIKNSRNLIEALSIISESEVPVCIIGGGTNILASDNDVEGIVLSMRNGDEPAFESNLLIADASASLSTVTDAALSYSIGGFEFLTGIPGTFGGAIAGNAGAFGKSISELLEWVEIWKPGEGYQRLKPDELGFEYRKCTAVNNEVIIIKAALSGEPADSEHIRNERNGIISFRKKRHPDWSVPCAGSFFKNPPPIKEGSRRRAAGELLEKVGAKGLQIGGAKVWEGHANFIINAENATCSDVDSLAEILISRVKETYDITLEREVRNPKWRKV